MTPLRRGLKPCLECGTLSRGPRCPRHTIAGERSSAERKRRSELIEAHVDEYGYVCPGYMREPHPATDLTADHIIPRVDGGEDGPLRVYCRGCNSSRGRGR